jgi:hypothetical protein
MRSPHQPIKNTLHKTRSSRLVERHGRLFSQPERLSWPPAGTMSGQPIRIQPLQPAIEITTDSDHSRALPFSPGNLRELIPIR